MNTYVAGFIPEFEKAIDHFLLELSQLRAGRATPALVEGISVDAYGVRSPIVQLASISIPEMRQIVIQPWDTSLLKNIEKAIAESGLGLNPANEGDCLRIMIPALTEELSEDERFRMIEELDKVIKSYQERIDQEAKKKEEEILT